MLRLKTLHIIDRLEIGGAEKVFLDLTHLLLNEEILVDTLLISGKGALYESIDVRAGKYFLNRKWKFNLLKLIECASICSRYPIVHVHNRYTYGYVRLAQIVSFKKFTIIFHDHYGDIEINSKIPRNLRGIFKPQYYVGVSQQLVNWAVEVLNIDTKRVFLLRNTVIPTYSEVQIKPDQNLLMISNIRATKNIELAVELANRLTKKLTIYGNSSSTNYSDHILKLVEASSYVDLKQGQTNIQGLFGNYSLAIHTSHSETGPLVLLEYLSAGLPFLAHATGEVAHVLKDELPECFLTKLEVEDWIKRINELLLNPPNSKKMKFLFKKHFGTKQYIHQCIEIYKKAIPF